MEYYEELKSSFWHFLANYLTVIIIDAYFNHLWLLWRSVKFIFTNCLADDRVGLLAIIVSDQSHIAIAKSHVELIGRRVHASSPHHGARIVSTILNNQALREEW